MSYKWVNRQLLHLTPRSLDAILNFVTHSHQRKSYYWQAPPSVSSITRTEPSEQLSRGSRDCLPLINSLSSALISYSHQWKPLSWEQTCIEASRDALRLPRHDAWCKLTTYICFFAHWHKPCTDPHVRSATLWWTDRQWIGPRITLRQIAPQLACMSTLAQHATLRLHQRSMLRKSVLSFTQQ